MEYEKGYVYELMDRGGPTYTKEPYFREAVEEMMRARTLCAKANATLPDDPANVSYLEELYGYPVNDCFAQDHNGLIIWSGCIEDMGLEVTTPVYSLDIVPTLSNLFGVDYDSRLLVGRDVFSDQEPLVLWPNCSWITDKGRYNARTNTFTPVEGVEIPDGYVDQIDTIVRQKIRYSKEVLDLDYFATIFGKK